MRHSNLLPVAFILLTPSALCRLTLIKVLAILIFFIVAIIINVGGIGGEYIGGRYFHDPGAFADGISGVAKIFVVAGTLYAGCESVGVVAGESANPAKAVPRYTNFSHRKHACQPD